MNRRKPNIKLKEHLIKKAPYYTIDELLPKINLKFNESYNRLDLQKYLVRNKIKYKYTNKNKSHNMSKLAIGTEYIKPDGMILIKVGRNKWKYKQRYIYEKNYNIKLKDDEYVIFLDQNRNNFSIDNLKAIKRNESAYMSNEKLFSNNKEITKVGINIAKIMIKTKELEKNTKNKINELESEVN